jgi:hypothetical protein
MSRPDWAQHHADENPDINIVRAARGHSRAMDAALSVHSRRQLGEREEPAQ